MNNFEFDKFYLLNLKIFSPNKRVFLLKVFFMSYIGCVTSQCLINSPCSQALVLYQTTLKCATLASFHLETKFKEISSGGHVVDRMVYHFMESRKTVSECAITSLQLLYKWTISKTLYYVPHVLYVVWIFLLFFFFSKPS